MIKPRIVVLVTVIHFITAFSLFLYSFSATMDRFDSNREASALEVAASTLSTIMFYPVMPLVSLTGKAGAKVFHGLFGYIPMIINSLVWGLSFSCLNGIGTKIRRRPNQAL